MNINFCTIDATVCRINKELVIKGASDIHTCTCTFNADQSSNFYNNC